MITIKRIPSGDNEHYTVFENNDVEQINPVEFYKNSMINVSYHLDKQLILKNPSFRKYPPQVVHNFLLKRATEFWQNQYEIYISTSLPANLISLFNSQTKKEQLNLLKNQSLTSNELVALMIQAGENHNFSFSQYTSDHLPPDYISTKIPSFIEKDGDKIKKGGGSELTDGQLRQIIDQRKRIVARFLDKNGEWHCFFGTLNSMNGNEKWKGGSNHIHYISDKFGFNRDEVVKQLKQRFYKLGSLPHIELIRNDV